MDQTPSIEVENLTKRYGPIYAIRDVSFSVNRGEVVGFLGPNGAGKTTTLRILCGIMPATSGRARVCGLSLARDSKEVRQRLGYMAENNPLPEHMRVVEYLRLRGRIKGLRGKELRDRVDEVMELCDLNRKTRRRLIGGLSKGYRQRVGIADAIVAEPEVAILDEPTIGLDPHQVLMIRELLSLLRGRMTVIISSHILSEIELSCDRAIIMNHGRVVAMGTSEELRREFVQEHTYVMEVAGDFASLVTLLLKLDPKMRVTQSEQPEGDSFYTVTVSSSLSDDLSEALLRRVHETPSHRLRSIHRQRATLEDVFLAATRRSWEQTASGKVNQSETVTAPTNGNDGQ